MRDDMTAAYLDFSNTADLAAAIRSGDAPAPSSLRGKGRKREPIWARDDLDRHIAPAEHRRQDGRTGENLSSLI
jgi:hypothetical protein